MKATVSPTHYNGGDKAGWSKVSIELHWTNPSKRGILLRKEHLFYFLCWFGVQDHNPESL